MALAQADFGGIAVPMKSKLLIVDDDASMIEDFVASTLSDLDDFDVVAIHDADKWLGAMDQGPFDVVLLDLNFKTSRGQRQDGLRVLPDIRKHLPEAEIIVHSNEDGSELIERARALGATTYLAKHNYTYKDIAGKVRNAIQRIVDRKGSAHEGVDLAQSVGAIFVSKAMHQVFTFAANVKKSDNVNVLINGPTGSGKELVAAAIGKVDDRRPYLAVNCATLTDGLVESELFGHEKGAFTGAHARKPGKFELANGGTLFLDEVGCLSRKAQEGLLRVLQSGEFMRVGGTATIKVKVRVICATNDDLEQKIAQGEFRADLYERLAMSKIMIPPLAERPDDIMPLAQHFLKKFGRAGMQIDPTCLKFLQRYSWPRNVRELENTIGHMVNNCSGNELEIADLPMRFTADLNAADGTNTSEAGAGQASSNKSVEGFAFSRRFGASLDVVIDECAAAYIVETAKRLGPGKSIRQLAEALHVPYSNLHRRLARYGISLERSLSAQQKGQGE